MSNKFDELAKGLAQSVTRRQALRRFGVGLAATALAAVGLGNRALAGPTPRPCASDADCSNNQYCGYQGVCVKCLHYPDCSVTSPPCGCCAHDFKCLSLCGSRC